MALDAVAVRVAVRDAAVLQVVLAVGEGPVIELTTLQQAAADPARASHAGGADMTARAAVVRVVLDVYASEPTLRPSRRALPPDDAVLDAAPRGARHRDSADNRDRRSDA